MIEDAIAQVGPWAWVIAGIALLGIEILVPGTFFLWFGLSAIVVGVLAVLFGLAWQIQIIVFGVLALVLVTVARPYFNRRMAGEPDSGLNERGARLIGTTYILTEPIVAGFGRVRVADSNWRVSGADMPSGVKVRVVGVDGSVLKVERTDGSV